MCIRDRLYFLRQVKEEHLVTGHNFSVYVDSPLAIEATNIFRENGADCYDEETLALIRQGINPLSFEGCLLYTSTKSRSNGYSSSMTTYPSPRAGCGSAPKARTAATTD